MSPSGSPSLLREAGIAAVAKTHLKFFHPRAQFHFPRPSAARLIEHVQIALRDGVRIKKRIRPIRWLDPARAADASIDHKMSNVNTLRCQLPSHALRQAA